MISLHSLHYTPPILVELVRLLVYKASLHLNKYIGHVSLHYITYYIGIDYIKIHVQNSSIHKLLKRQYVKDMSQGVKDLRHVDKTLTFLEFELVGR